MEPSLLAAPPPPFQENGEHTFIPCLIRMLKLTAAVVIEGANRKYAVVKSWKL